MKKRSSRPPESEPTQSADRHDDDGIGSYLRAGKIVILLLFLGVGGWATFSKISGAVIAAGSIAVEAKSKTVQHLEGGIVGQIHVKDGDMVNAGDLLIVLDSTQIEQQIAGITAEIDSKDAEIELIKGEMAGLQDLHERGLVPKTRIIALQRQAARLDGERKRLAADKARTDGRLDRLSVRAPIGGHVHDLALHTIGGVISPGQQLMQIVPSTGSLIVQARVDPLNVDQVNRGQAAAVRLVGFNQRTTPEVDGEVVHVSADLSHDEQRNASFYVVHIAFADGELDRLGRDLLPGMPVDSFIQTEERSALSYLTRPLTDQLARAFREE